MRTTLLLLLFVFCLPKIEGQTNIESIQTGVTFQWADNQTSRNQPATIESITVNNNVYFNFGVPTAYEMTQLGPGGHNRNKIRLNGGFAETTSASATWDASALAAYRSLNLNYYFESSSNGANICDDYTAEETTNAQRKSLIYADGIIASTSGVIAITERNANNCYHIEFFGYLPNSSVEESLGETFVNQTSTRWGFGGTGSNSNLGTPGAVSPPPAGSDYWLSDRVVENRGTIGVAIFYLNDIAPTGSTITRATLTAATTDNGDGKMFILTLPDHDKDGMSDIDDLDDENDGIKDVDESGGVDPSADHDVDGTPNYMDPDFCVLNSAGICANMDFDSDGIPNHFDFDSDNDGITDVMESGGADIDPTAMFEANDGMAYGRVGATATTFGIPQSAGTGTVPINTDGNGGFDFLDIDSDNDGIPDNIEAQPTHTYIPPSGIGQGMIDANNDGYDDVLSISRFPEDTDYDGIDDYRDTDADNDGLLDIEENGMMNSVIGADVDSDGLDNRFEGGAVNDGMDVNDEINDPTSSVLPDTEGDLFDGGDLDYRDLFNVNPPVSSTLDFDGIDDHLTREKFIEGLTEVSVMAWVKTDVGSSGTMTILGEGDGFRLFLANGTMPALRFKVQGEAKKGIAAGSLPQNEWHHIAGTYSGSTGLFVLYIDGEVRRRFQMSTTGLPIELTSLSNGAFEVGRLSQNVSNRQYFKGDIDEVRVFDVALTETQIQQLVYQEVVNVGGKVQGSVIPKDIIDFDTEQTLSWNNLIAYYPMTAIKNNTTNDYSGQNKTLSLRNINSALEQTAPMPYITGNDGNWETTGTWLHGDVWDIEDATSNKDWSIVDIRHNINSSSSHTHLGLLVDSGKQFTITGDNKLENQWYLELDGTIDLQGDSQLIQDSRSDLVTSATGKLLRRQEGNSSVYWYNYWSSPVGALGATTLTDNNGTSNNGNNSDFSLNMLKEGDGSAIQFTSAFHEPGKLSTRWLYTFENGVTYYDYTPLFTTTGLTPGVGYTQKGMGNPGDSQQYLFEGKPNNGTILINVTDTGGSGSVPAVSRTSYILGNPYASALDISKFIDDNQGVISGSIQLWQQWSGSSHVLNEYNGGYAQVNKLGSVRAYQFVGIEGANNGSQDGTKTPTGYLPVGQGFMAEIIADGQVEFNNSQRVFIKESDANGSFNNGSVFFRTQAMDDSTEETADTEAEQGESVMQKIRLEFNAVTGPATRRELLLGFSDYTSDAYDYGYDAIHIEDNADDLSLIFQDDLMTIQAYSQITADKTVPLELTASGSYTYSIKATNFVDLQPGQEVYLKDNLKGTYFDLRSDQAYEFSSEAGTYSERFEIVFQSEETLSVDSETYQYHLVYFNNQTDKLIAKGFNKEADQVMLINILGQTIVEYNNVSSQELDAGLDIPDMSSGTYIVYIKSDDQVTTKKVIIK